MDPNDSVASGAPRAPDVAFVKPSRYEAMKLRESEEQRDIRKRRNRDHFLKRAYGISLDQYEHMLGTQNGVCKICSKKCKSGRRLAVDHCHTTGVVRGLLCIKCNRGLGGAKDNINLIQACLNYLIEKGYALQGQREKGSKESRVA